jgi:glycosyltransferase involved in cell wall biosynthesis
MRILALEPYHGGSHRAFLDGWSTGSAHRWTVFGLPPRSWRWRMRHAAVTFAERVERHVARGESWDVILAGSMLDLAQFRRLPPGPVGRLPAVVYFHENQITYPSRRPDARDLHFAYTHFTSCLAADAVWFNSAFHRDAFLGALEDLLGRMPDFDHRELLPELEARASVRSPGCEMWERVESRPRRRDLTIVWAARWEHDKNPEDFFVALMRLAESGIPFRAHVVGESFREQPEVFERARAALGDRIATWGYRALREDYRRVLEDADVIVSTARHEFFGVSVVEAIIAGCVPLLPDRLAYSEILGRHREHLYDGSVDGLVARLTDLAGRLAVDRPLPSTEGLRADVSERYGWPNQRPRLDAALPRTRPRGIGTGGETVPRSNGP